MASEEVTMMMSVVPGAMTGFATLMSGLVSVNNVFMDMTRQVDSTFGLVDATIVTTGTVVAQLGFQAAQAFGEFEQGMKVVQMVSGQTKSDITELSNTANQFAVQYRMDIDQITEGLQTLGRAGLNSASEQSEVLKNGLNTAKLEGRDLNGVLEELIQNTALLGGNLKSDQFGEQSEYVNDLLVATSMTAPITTHDVSETLKYSGGIAAAAGANIETEEGKAILEDYMGAIAAFAQKGVTGSIAGTALRAFFNKPATQDSSVTEALGMLHLKPEYLWEDDEETMKPVSEQIRIIKDQMDELNISTMDQLQIWSKIVGGKMGQQMMKLDSEDIQSLTSDIRAADDASNLAAGSMQTFQSNMKEMSEQGQVAFRQFGERVAIMMNPAIDAITELLKLLSNPVSSTALMAGFLSFLGLVGSRIKKIIGTLKDELGTFMDYFKRQEQLMSVRPSVVRGLERKSNREKSYTDFRKASVDADSPEAILKELKKSSYSGFVEGLRKKGVSDAEIGILEHTKTWTGTYDDKAFSSAWLSASGLNSMPKDNMIFKSLIESGRWKDEWTNAIYNGKYGIMNKEEFMSQFGADVYKEFENYINESSRAAQNHAETLNNAARTISISDEDYKKALKVYEDSPRKNLDNINEMYPGFKERFEKEQEKEKNTPPQSEHEGNIGMPRDPTKITDKDWYTNSVTPGYISQEALEWLKQQEQQEQQGQQKQQEQQVNNNEEKSSGFRLSEIPYYKFVDIKGGLDEAVDGIPGSYLIDHLYPLGTVGGKDIGDNKDWEHFKKRNTILANSEIYESLGFSLLGSHFNMTPADFLNSIPEEAELSEAKTFAKFYEDNAKQFFTFRDRQTNAKFQLPISRIVEDYMNLSIPNISKEEFGAFTTSSGTAMKDIFKGKTFDKMYARFNKMVEDGLRHYLNYLADQIPVIPEEDIKNKAKDIKYPSLKELEADRFGKIMTKNEIKKVLTEKGISYDTDMNKSQLAKLAGGHILDWETMDWNDFRRFAKKEGVSAKGSREDIINRLNEKYSQELPPKLRNWLNDYDTVKESIDNNTKNIDNPISEGRSGQPDLNDLARDAESYREQARKQVELNRNARESKEALEKAMNVEGIEKELDDLEKNINSIYDVVSMKLERLNNEIQQELNALSHKSNIPDIPHYDFVDEQEVKEESLRKRREKNIDSLRNQPTIISGMPSYLAKKQLGLDDDEDDEDAYYQSTYGRSKKDIIKGFRGIAPDEEEVNSRGISERFRDSYNSFYDKIKNPFSGLGDRLKDSLFSSNRDSFLRTKGSFKELSGMQKLGNMLGKGIDLAGGPLLIAIELATVAINTWKQWYQEYTDGLKDAIKDVKDAYSKRDSAENSIRQNLRESNPDITDEELDEQVYAMYGELYDNLTTNQKKFAELSSKGASTMDELEYDEEKDDGSYKKKEDERDEETRMADALKENTAALYSATSQLNFALTNLQTKMTDSWWGLDGWTGEITNSLGEMVDKISNTQGTSFNENGGNFLLTAQQQDENYSGYTEMSGLMLEDFKDSKGDWQKGLETMMGEDAKFTTSIMGQSGKDWMDSIGKLSYGKTGMSSEQNARLQASMKYDQKSWNKLAKDIAKFESKNKKTYDSKKGLTEKKIENQIKKLQSTLGAGFDRTRVLQAAYLEIAQGMYAVAQTVFVPLIQQNATSAAQAVAGIGGVHSTVGGTGSNTYNTAAIASSIAAMLGTIALAQAGDAAKTQASLGVDLDNSGTAGDTQEEKNLQELALNTESGTEFMNEALKQSKGNATLLGIGDWFEGVGKSFDASKGGASAIDNALFTGTGKFFKSMGQDSIFGKDRAAADWIAKVYGVSTYMSVYGMNAEDAEKKYDDWYNKEGKKNTPENIMKTLGKNWQFKGFLDQIEQAYLNSGEEGNGSGGGGGGSGSGSGKDKDKDNTGTRKERVDLVLCNKKEIPKLNVNLFKKPPTFTVLNKNFKLRDVKINTQDKPKAIMASIKNAFIDVQKRSDPKIIQDEEAEYDPAGATEGNAVPSGEAKTKTNR